jgi:hypothetical protein
LLYLFIRTNENGDIILNSSDTTQPIGHIVMTDVGSGALAEEGGHIGVRMVESTASHNPPGLTENWYKWLDEKNAGTANAHFRVDRGAAFVANRDIWFAIARVDPAGTA